LIGQDSVLVSNSRTENDWSLTFETVAV